jgi:hypothetical protein
MKNTVFWDFRPCGLVRTNVSEELSASIIRVKTIGELGTLVVTSNRSKPRRNSISSIPVSADVVPSSLTLVTLMMAAIRSYETSILTKATRCNISEGGILHSYRRENLKSYTEIISLSTSDR